VTRILIGVLLVCAAPAQLTRIGDIDFYGLRKTTAEQILAAARIAPGDPVPASRGDLEDRITALPDVVAAQVQAVCCQGERATLFIGIQERAEPAPTFRLPPLESAGNLPADLMTRYQAYEGALVRAVMNHKPSGPALRSYEQRFQAYAAAHRLLLRLVLRQCSDAEQRAAAATVIAYAADKKAVVDDLLFALQDPDEAVRTNAMRSLATLVPVARQQPALGIRIPAEGFIDLLNSVVLSDRVESTNALLVLTAKPNAAALDLIRAHALPSLAEMARWKTLAYAQPPFQLLGRVAGLPDVQVNQAWEKGDRESVIQKALDSAAGKQGLQ
jgi:hypothetical protein